MGEEIKIESNMGTEDILQKNDGTKSWSFVKECYMIFLK